MSAILAWALAASPPAHGFTTRAHIAIANDLRQGLIDSGDGTLALRGGTHAVQLDPEDAQAIIDEPLAFRAGAIGPDNFAFPVMTDPTHALGTDPFRQCEMLYQAALTPDERAYALGCFVHGGGDLAAHHFVNWLSGESFTLTPIAASRGDSLHNVIRHIVAEAMIQEAMAEARPGVFDQDALLHDIPLSLILRTYLDDTSALWQLAATHALHKVAAAQAADASLTVSQAALAGGLAPAEQLVLIPVILGEIDALVVGLEADVALMLSRLQNPKTPEGAELLVGPGDDGELGTLDDTTECSVSCPSLFGQYFGGIGLLLPRQDAGGDPLPSSLDKMATELRAELFEFNVAYVETIEQVSALLNRPWTPGAAALDITSADLHAALAPLRAWLADVTAIDYETVVVNATPEWLQEIETLLNAAGVNLDIAGLLRALFQPLIDQVSSAIEQVVVEEVEVFVDELVGAIEAEQDVIAAEFQERLEAASPEGRHVLDHIDQSGLMLAAHDLSAAALAERQVLQSDPGDYERDGPASFDASHGPSWSKAAACPHLAPAIFPLGADLNGLMSLRIDGTDHRARVDEDSPNECHDGALDAFAADPGPPVCALTDLETLLGSPVGSLSRAFAPSVVGIQPACGDLRVPGLPGPEGDDGPEPTGDPPDDGGCGCAAAGSGSGGWGLLLVLLWLGACGGREPRDPDGTTGGDGDTDATTDTDAGQTDDARALLLDALGDSTWRGTAVRGDATRKVEQHFRAGSLLWAELVNPWGPARSREMRVFAVEDDGLHASSTVTVPAGWEATPEVGREDSWTIEVRAGSPRSLVLVRNGVTETYEEGAWEEPDRGLAATVRVFESGGPVDDAFCNAGFSFDYHPLLAFARGTGATPLAEDAVVGADLAPWIDGGAGNQFAVRDVAGFDRDGGTALSDQFDFMVTFRGEIDVPAGTFAMREQDDLVEDAVWIFLGDAAGSGLTDDIFLEVHGFIWPDATPDEPSVDVPAGRYGFEAILVRCDVAIADVHLEWQLDGGAWSPAVDLGTVPVYDEAKFPPVF